LVFVAIFLPVFYGFTQIVQISNPLVPKALPSQDTQLAFSKIQSASMFWRMPEPMLFTQIGCNPGLKSFVKSRFGMRVKLSETSRILSAPEKRSSATFRAIAQNRPWRAGL